LSKVGHTEGLHSGEGKLNSSNKRGKFKEVPLNCSIK
jgi:hypothetical protein